MAYAVVLSMVVVLCRPILGPIASPAQDTHVSSCGVFFYSPLVGEGESIIAGVMAYAVMLSMVVVLCRSILGPMGWINKKHREGSVLFVVVVFKRLFVGFFGGGVGAVAHGGGIVI